MRRFDGGNRVRRIAAMLAFSTGAIAAAAPQPVTFSFRPAGRRTDPFAREIWAEVVTPSHRTLRLPAYYAGHGTFAVRARAEETGAYRLGAVTEDAGGGRPVAVALAPAGVQREVIHEVETRPPVKILREPRPRFVFAGGGSYAPVGANLAWPTGPDRAGWYAEAFRQFSEAGLNWARVWMSSWGGLNLDWLPKDLGKSPPPGQLDERVAGTWDRIVSSAEERGVYLQVVLQHHGQFSSKVNPNWSENPWNAANPGGFLRSPADFFTSAEAIRLTRQKYRTIVARWGYSPAVLAWELFNEVHWVDALQIDHDTAAVAKWHDGMAAYIRSVDAYGHLVTTSTEDLRSPIYRSMDYFQPHLYATNMLAAARRFDVAPGALDRPVFYGEMGDDNMRLTPAQKNSGVELGPIVWASLMGEGRDAAQIWEGGKFIEQGRLGELGAVAKFLKATGLARRNGLEAFSAAVAGGAPVPLELEPGSKWQRGAPPEFDFPTDGRQVIAAATLPAIFVGSPKSVADGYPDRATLHVNYPEPATAHLRFADAGKLGAVARVEVDGKVAAEHAWPAMAAAAAGHAKARPADLSFAVAAGEHTIVISNPGGQDWFELAALDFGLETSALATIGRRSADFMALWVWNRRGVFAMDAPAPTAGTILIAEVPAGTWRVTWWDSVTGVAGPTTTIEHAGGVLQLPTPPISRQAAVVVER